MTDKVNPTPNLPRPGHRPDSYELLRYDQEFMRAVFNELLAHAHRLNLSAQLDGSEVFTAPARLVEFTVATLPSASLWTSGLIAVTNETGGYTVAFSDGTNWRRVQDRAVVS